MVVGQFGVGKTTLIKRLLGQQVDISKRKSTEGIDIHKHCCKISLDKGEWIQELEDSDQLFRLQRLMKLLSELDQKSDIIQEQGHTEIIYQRESTPQMYSNKNNANTNQEVPLAFLQQNRGQISIHVSESKSSESRKKDAVMEIFRLINKNANKIETDLVKYAVLSVWDFAGQYIFYTTHQTFLTSRAIYLLVVDLTQQVMDLIQDDKCFVDTDGIKLCKVHDLIEIWMNSIHTCAPSSEASIPVILVGTHVDKLSEDKRQEIIDRYFPEICRLLKDKPALRHIVKFVPIDNTKHGPHFDNLKDMIFEIASKQHYWGEEVPTSWIPMEEALMDLKASGKKVIPCSLVEELNQAASVPIKDAEQLDLFLRFHHEIGTILYFSTDRLKEKIVLDPQWFINALKSLITAETFFLEKYPAIRSKWFELKDNGKLTPELIDAVWTRENNPEFYENKEYMLDMMEKLNIIAKPKSYIEGRQEFMEETYFIAPCMLREKTPEEIICPKPHPQMDNSSVLCYVFVDKFFPVPIFHRLLAACIARWPIAKQNKENQIFCGCCVFQLVQNHKLTIHFREHVIFVRVARKGIKDRTPSPKLCIEVREVITSMLNSIIGNLGQNLKFEYCIQCPECNSDTVNGLFLVSQLQENAEVECDFHDIIESHQLLSFWFQDEQVVRQISSRESNVNPHEECHSPVQRRYLPPGKKYHVFFSYSSSDIQWVKNTVETLEKDHGLVCCEYDRDNTPGTSLLKFAGDSIMNAYKTVVVMTREALKSGFVLHEIEMAIIQGYNESRKCVVPVLLEDCEVPAHLNVLNYIDARDPKLKNIWWPKFITELETVKLQPLALGALKTALSEAEKL